MHHGTVEGDALIDAIFEKSDFVVCGIVGVYVDVASYYIPNTKGRTVVIISFARVDTGS